MVVAAEEEALPPLIASIEALTVTDVDEDVTTTVSNSNVPALCLNKGQLSEVSVNVIDVKVTVIEEVPTTNTPLDPELRLETDFVTEVSVGSIQEVCVNEMVAVSLTS